MKKICTQPKPFFNEVCRFFQLLGSILPHIITVFVLPVKSSEKENAAAIATASGSLLLAEGLTVGALILSGICLVGTHQNAVQRTVVLGVAVVSAGLNSTFDALVCIAVHARFLLFLISALVFHRARK